MRSSTAITWVVLAAATAGCHTQTDAEANNASQPSALSISVATATQEDVPKRVDVTGTLAAWLEATVSLEADGRLIAVNVDLGDRVRAGDVLARVAPQIFEYRKAQAEAELQAAKADFKRLTSLAGKDMATQQQLDESQRRLGMAQANADLTRKQLADAVLRAPIDGRVSRRMINNGEYVRIGTPAFTLVRTSPLKLRLDVPERYLADVKVGDQVETTIDALRGKSLQCKVERIGPAVAVDTRSFSVEARCENEDGTIKPGTFARATILTGVTTNAITLPESAVAMFAGNPRVFVVNEGRVREQPIEVAGRALTRIVVGKGLKPGEKVAISSVDRLSDGAPVTIREAESVQ